MLMATFWHMQNNKDYFDQSLDEIKLLRYINDNDPADEHGVLRLYDYFYFKVKYHVAATEHVSGKTLPCACSICWGWNTAPIPTIGIVMVVSALLLRRSTSFW